MNIIENTKLTYITIDPARFQRRGKPYDERHVEKLVATWDIARCAPLIVWHDGDRLYLLSGHHRYEAAWRLGIESLPCQALECPETEAIRIAVEDNFGRLEYSHIELSRLIKEYREKGKNNAEIAAITGYGETYVRECYYLNFISSMIAERVEARTLDYRVAAIIGRAGMPKPDGYGIEPEQQNEFLEVCIDGRDMTITALRECIKRFAPRAVAGELFGLDFALKRESKDRAAVNGRLMKIRAAIKALEGLELNGELNKGLVSLREQERRTAWELARLDAMAAGEPDPGEYKRNNRRGEGGEKHGNNRRRRAIN